MKAKNIKFIAIFLVLLLCLVGAVSAADNTTTTQEVTADQTANTNTEHKDISKSVSTDDTTPVSDDTLKKEKKDIKTHFNDTDKVVKVNEKNTESEKNTINNAKDKTKLGASPDNNKLSVGNVAPTYTIDVTPNKMSGSNYVAQYGQTIIVNGTFGNATGDITITFGYSGNYQTFKKSLTDGKFTQELTNYTIRNNYQIKVEYAGNDYYKKATWQKNIHIQGNDITANSTDYGLIAFMDVNLYNATGNVTFTHNGKTYTGKLANGKFIQEFKNYTIGKNTVEFVYEGDDKFNSLTKTYTFNVNANIYAPTIYNFQPAIIKVHLGEATGKVNITLGNENYTADIISHTATTEVKNYVIGTNTLTITYFGDDTFAPFTTTKTFEVLDKENATIISTVYKKDNKNILYLYIPNSANGTVNVTVNGNPEIWNLINDTAQKEFIEDIIKLNVSYEGNTRLNPRNSSFFVKIGKYNIINSTTYLNFFNQKNNGKLFDFIEDGVTLDFQGSIINPDTNNVVQITINKPVNIISSTKDAYIDLNTTAGSLLGESPGNSFAILRGGSGSNITGIYLHNTQLWISNTTNVVLDNISVVVEDQRVGSGVGATSIRENSSYVTLKNSYLYTRNNGGSTTFTISWADHCTFDNNTIKAEGNVGNLVYLNIFNIAGAPTGVPLNNYNKIINNRIYGKEGSAISVGLMVEGTHNLIENNTLYKSSISTSFGGVNPSNNTYVGNTMTEGSGLTAQAYSIVYNNNVTGALSTGANSIAYNNTVGKGMTVGANAKAYNNTIGTTMTINGADAEAYNNTIGTTMTINGANAKAYNNIITNLEIKKNSVNVTKNTILGNITFAKQISNSIIANNIIKGNIVIPSNNNAIIFNNITGKITLDGSHNNITNNRIITNDEYTITSTIGQNNIITGNYLVAKTFIGDKTVNLEDASNIIENNVPLNVKIEITVNPENTVNKTATIIIVLKDEYDNIIANQKVNLTIGSSTQEVDLKNGFILYTYTPETIGEDTVTVKYNGDGIYLPATNDTILNVTADKDKIIQALEDANETNTQTISDLNKEITNKTGTIDELNNTVKAQNTTIQNQDKTIQNQTETIKEQDNKIQNQTETIKEQDNKIQNQTQQITEANNKATVAEQKANQATVPIKTAKASKTVKKSKNYKIKVTLKKAVKGKKVFVIFNGKTYTAKTNKKGIATITIKKSALKKLGGKKVKYQIISGEKIIKKTVKVKK